MKIWSRGARGYCGRSSAYSVVVPLQFAYAIDDICRMKTVGNVEDYLKHLYSQIGGVPENITQVLAVPMGARKPAAYRVIRSNGDEAVIWRKYIDQNDVEKISRSLAKIC